MIMSSLRYRFPLDHKNLMFMVMIMSSLRYRFPLDHKNLMFMVMIMSSLRYRFPLDHKNLMFLVMIMIMFMIVVPSGYQALSASQEFPRRRVFKILASLPEESWLFPVIELSRIDRYWSFLGFCISCPQFSFVVPTVECIRGYDIDLTIYPLFWTSQMMFVLWWSPERFLKSLSSSCKNVLCFLSLSLLEQSYIFVRFSWHESYI